MVEQAMTYVGELQGQDKLKLIECLREVTEGKVCTLKIQFQCAKVS